MLTKDPAKRIKLADIKTHPWVTCNGTQPLLTEAENCHLVTVTEDEIKSCVTVVPKLYAYVSIQNYEYIMA